MQSSRASGFLVTQCLLIVAAQKYGNDLPLVVPTDKNAQFPDLITSDNFPLFPFTDQFNTGIELNPANKITLAGDLNVPVPGWGNFDVDGNIYTGNINFDSKVGYQIRPTNHLNIKPETLALIHQNPAFRKARKEVREVSLGRLPYGYEPIRCKPPYCNPFVHHTAVGVEVEQGDDTFFIGGVDFPMPVGTNGAGVRFPLSGAFEQGSSPYAYAHGDAYNPVSVFDLAKIDNLPGRKSSKRRAPKKASMDSSEEEESTSAPLRHRRRRSMTMRNP